MEVLLKIGTLLSLVLFSILSFAHEQSVEIFQGHVGLVNLGSSEEKMPELECEGQGIPVIKFGGVYKAYLRESHHAKIRKYKCKVNQKEELNVSVKAFNFPSSRLKVDHKKIDLSKKDLDRYLKEKAALQSVFSAGEKTKPFFQKAFAHPVDSIVTGVFGTRRVFNKKKESVHLGVDYRAAVGTPIYATNDGKVVLSDELFFNGGTVIIDHGAGIFSMYCHLSEQKVNVGHLIKQGEILGLAGKSGRSTGPHLHWGIKMYGEWIDGVSLVQAGP